MKKFKDELILFDVVGRLWFSMKRWGKQYLSDLKYDLTMEQLIVLTVLDEAEDGVPIKVLADLIERERTTTSRMIDGLEKRNLVLKVNDKRDNRQKLVYLTHLARERLEVLHKMADNLKETAFAKINMEDILKAEKLLNDVADNLIGKCVDPIFMNVAISNVNTTNNENK